MNLSVNPTYYCNFRCSFCYLGDKLSDKKKIKLSDLEERLEEVSDLWEIENIDLYGGEISELPMDYQEELIALLSKYAKNPIMITTNYSDPCSLYETSNTKICISYDYKAREQWDKVMLNIITEGGNNDVLMLASKNLLRFPVEEIVANLNMLGLNSVEIKPYSSNQYNQQAVSFKDYENFIKKFIELKGDMNFVFQNELLIEQSLEGKKNAYSNDHIYITPNNKFAVLEFDAEDNEFFMELEGIQDYITWTKKENNSIDENSYCNTCEYKGKCLTEHYRFVSDMKESCNGFKGLLDWYKERK
jgi:MoaA/NifB/PqqE/SkfB family radical SAM enzyme